MEPSVNADRTLIIVPTYNERENIPALFERIFDTVPDADLLLVDDNSPDGTADLAGQLFGEDPRFYILRRTGPRGLGRSYVEGYQWALTAGYARVAQMDADFSHDPKYLPALIEASRGADVVLGSRYCPGGGVQNWPFHRLFLSKFANRYVCAITGLPVRDSTSGFRCYTQRALERVQVHTIESNGYAFQVEMTYRARAAGLRIEEIPILFVDRTQGRSKLSRKVLIESMIMPWRLRFSRRTRAVLRTIQPLEEK
jgi:dolichol-phosphate mannosyltransferase